MELRRQAITLHHLLKRPSPIQMALILFLVSFVAYASITPWIVRHWQLTGDEPYYLLIAHSLAFDHDFDLANNYQNKDYTYFYPASSLNAHTVRRGDGKEYSWHGIGLPLLLAPFYSLGGRLGATYFLNVVAALLAANVFLLSFEITRLRTAALLTWAMVAFAPPILLYAFLIYPETMGGLIALWGMQWALWGSRDKTQTWFAVGLCAAVLPWLVIRFIVLSAALLAIVSMANLRKSSLRRLVVLLAPVIVSAIGYAAFSIEFYGTLSPPGALAGAGFDTALLRRLPKQLLTGAVGWLFDQKAGLLFYAPIYGLAPLGCALLVQHRRRALWPLPLAITLHYGSVAALGFWTQWSVPTRYLVAILPLAGGTIAYALAIVRSRLFLILCLLLWGVSLVIGWTLMLNPNLAYNYRTTGQGARLWNRYSQFLHLDLTGILPSFDTTSLYDAEELPHSTGKVVSDPDALDAEVCVRRRKAVLADPTADPPGYLTFGPYVTLQPGQYRVVYRLKAGERVSNVVATIDVVADEGKEVLARREIAGTDFAKAGRYQNFPLLFHNLGGEPLEFRIHFAGTTPLWADYVQVSRSDFWGSWGLALLWTVLLGAFVAWGCRRAEARPLAGDKPAEVIAPLSGRVFFGLVVALVAIGMALVAVGFRQMAGPRRYESADLLQATGQLIADEGARHGWAARADPTADAEGFLCYGPYDIPPAGKYRVRFRLKIGESGAKRAVVAAIDVAADTGQTVLARQEIRAEDFAIPGRYQEFELEFTNPKPQALEFRVYFTGVVNLWIDNIEVVPLHG
ncbi:MAG: hypothetical protein U9Q78_09140 [Chloroflexota bacterium]|nr:hypothetical protein [Chloroflexota bacterium]